jgi:hypothetical protein
MENDRECREEVRQTSFNNYNVILTSLSPYINFSTRTSSFSHTELEIQQAEKHWDKYILMVSIVIEIWSRTSLLLGLLGAHFRRSCNDLLLQEFIIGIWIAVGAG